MRERTSRPPLALRLIRRLDRLLKWWALQLRVVPRATTTPRSARWSLLSLDTPAGLGHDWPIWKRIAPESFVVNLDLGEIHFSRDTINSDRGTYGEIFVEDEYSTDYSGAHVIDIGAHKGYFAAYALVNSAASVASYEPEGRNFASLERAAESFRRRGCDWKTINAAVGSRDGDVDLHVSRESWTHSIVSLPEEERGHELAPQRVQMVSMRSILQRIGEVSDRVIVKIDAEGAECDIVLQTPSRYWVDVDYVFLEFHSTAPCSARDLTVHLERAGFGAVPAVGGVLRFDRATEHAPSQTRRGGA
jgi:FkbM family methyltransferase